MPKSASQSGKASKKETFLSTIIAGVFVGDGYPIRVMAAINVSPESFYSASVARGRRQLAQRARQVTDEGASFIDLGAMSTAPYRAGWIDPTEERRRLVAAINVVRDETNLPISVDTQRAQVAEAALAAGARIVNDVSGLAADPLMGRVARQAEGIILMAQPTKPSTEPPVRLVRRLLRACLARAERAHLPMSRIVLDPGIGFYRLSSHPWFEVDVAILAALRRFRTLGHPLLVGASRKSFLGEITGRKDPAERLPASLAAATIAALHGAAIIRAHDVAPTMDALAVAGAVLEQARELR